jgi:hypothetical protein
MLLDELLRAARVPSAGGRFFSPSARAAAEVGARQKRGAWSQLRAAMLKAGAKPDEMEWTGLDREMAARKGAVDTDEIVRYLRDRSNVLDEEEATAQGILRNAPSDRGDLMQRFVETRLDDEIEYFRTDVLPDDVRGRAVRLADLDDDDLIALADAAPGGPLPAAYDRNATLAVLKETYGDDAVAIPSREFGRGQTDPLIVTDETIPRIVDDWLDPVSQAQDSLWNDASMLSYGDLLDELGLAGAADTSGVQYAKHYPEGAIDYTERTFQLDRDMTPVPTPFSTADDPHWNAEDIIGHTRTARFPTREGGEAYHLGEIQSDWAQRARRKGARTLDEEDMLSRASDARTLLAEMIGDIPQRAVEAVAGEGRPFYRPEAAGVVEAFGLVTPRRADAVNRVIGSSSNRASSTAPFLRVGGIDPASPDAARDRFGDFDRPRSVLNALARNVSDPRQPELPGLQNPVRAVADDLAAYAMSRSGVKSLDELRGLLDALDGPLRDREPAGPGVHTTDKWVDMLLRRELGRALDSGADYMTVPTPSLVRRHTGGKVSGHETFYGEIVPRRLAELLKRYDPEAAKRTTANIVTESDGDVTVPAFRITPRLREEAERRGIPLWALVGAAPLGLLDAAEQRGPR